MPNLDFARLQVKIYNPKMCESDLTDPIFALGTHFTNRVKPINDWEVRRQTLLCKETYELYGRCFMPIIRSAA